MALLTDGHISVLADLQGGDSTILETARTESIALDAKLRIATEHIELEVAAFLLRNQAGSVLPSSHSSYDLGRVVVTTGLRRWHTLRTLVEVYSDAYNSQLNDRYLGKWKHFAGEARETAELLFDLGIGMVASPVPRARKAQVTVAGSGGIATTYYVSVAWRGANGSSGAPSEPATFAANDGEVFQVDAGEAPPGATGWDVYVGSLDEAPARQNGTPLAVGQFWLLPGTGLVSGPSPGTGQSPDYYVRRSRVI